MLCTVLDSNPTRSPKIYPSLFVGQAQCHSQLFRRKRVAQIDTDHLLHEEYPHTQRNTITEINGKRKIILSGTER